MILRRKLKKPAPPPTVSFQSVPRDSEFRWNGSVWLKKGHSWGQHKTTGNFRKFYGPEAVFEINCKG